LARATGWGYREIMEEVPLSAGLQIIDADMLSQGILRHRWQDEKTDFDSLRIIEEAFAKMKQ
jgi:hypothetical protein